MEPHKVNVVNILQLIASIDDQDKYNSDVPIANVSHELVNQWFDDSFLKNFDWFRYLFSQEEWNILNEFSDFYEERLDNLPDTYEELRDNYFWKEIIGKANWALEMLGWQGMNATYD